jgi:hypothetical protein
MKSFIKTITVVLILNLAVPGFALAQDTPEKELEKIEEKLAQKKAELQKITESLAQKEAEIAQKAAEVAKNVAKATQKSAEAVAKDAKMQTARALEQARLSLGLALSKQYGGAGTVLVVPTAETKPQDLAAITQDLNIMLRILEKELNPDRRDRLSGFYWDKISGLGHYKSFFSGDDRAARAIYVQGYGALFLLKVDFPLSPPPETPQEKKTEEDIDSVWAETKREIYTPEDAERRRSGRSSRHQRGRSEEKYDAQKVENLKTTLVKTLKHAANIRILKPDESVILTVTGSGESGGGITAIATTKIVGHEDHNTRIVEELAPGGLSTTMLVIRAKKSDIDGFAKAELDFDQFRQRAQILACPYLGGGARHGDFFGDW